MSTRQEQSMANHTTHWTITAHGAHLILTVMLYQRSFPRCSASHLRRMTSLSYRAALAGQTIWFYLRWTMVAYGPSSSVSSRSKMVCGWKFYLPIQKMLVRPKSREDRSATMHGCALFKASVSQKFKAQPKLSLKLEVHYRDLQDQLFAQRVDMTVTRKSFCLPSICRFHGILSRFTGFARCRKPTAHIVPPPHLFSNEMLTSPTSTP
jgi:hypothetical protein